MIDSYLLITHLYGKLVKRSFLLCIHCKLNKGVLGLKAGCPNLISIFNSIAFPILHNVVRFYDVVSLVVGYSKNEYGARVNIQYM